MILFDRDLRGKKKGLGELLRNLSLVMVFTGIVCVVDERNASPAAAFDGFNGLKNAETMSSYLRNWGKPDFFLISHLSKKPAKPRRVRIDLWVYAEKGLELLFEDGRIVRQYVFNPREGKKLFPASNLSPIEFSLPAMNKAEIKQRFGEPSKVKELKVAGQTLTIMEYAGASSKVFGFTNNMLTLVSAGFRPGMKNPWLSPIEDLPAGNPSAVLGNWNSNFGNLNLRISSANNKFVEGTIRSAGDKTLSADSIVSIGSFDNESGFLKLNIRNANMQSAHAELLRSPDGKSFSGTLNSGNNEWDCWPFQIWR